MAYRLTMFVIFLLKGYESYATPTLSPVYVDVFENESIKLTCSVSLPGTSFRWSNTPNVWSRIECYNNKSYEIFSGFLSEERHLYAFYCFGNGSFTLQILSVEARQKGQIWQCGSLFDTSNKVPINVKGFESHATPNLSPEHVDVFENESIKLTCSLPLPGTSFRWSYTPNVWSRIECYSNKTYQIFTGFLSEDKHLYVFYCFGNGSFTLQILSVEARQTGQIWQCGSLFDTSNKVPINVKVPVKAAILQEPNHNYMQENQSQSIMCTSSFGRPDPTVKWFVRNPRENMKYQLTQLSSNTIIRRYYGLKAVVSTLNFKPNRTINKWRLYCEVWTGTSEADITSREISVNVSYPPDNLPVIQGISTNNIVQVIESDTGTFICSITGGNPPASLQWDCFDSTNVTYDTQENNRVTSTVHWKADRNQNTCSCTSEHIINWMRVINVSFNVQYPPTKPTLKITISKETRQINVTTATIRLKERENINMTCFSEGNPIPKYTWDSHNDQIHETIRQFANISRQDAGNYTCYVRNLMKRTFGDLEHGLNSSSIYLDIMYPSTIASLEDVSIPEGSNLNVTCQIQRGNPSYETISWTRQSDSKNWKDSRLTITNVSRTDDTNYTCTLQNTIIPTIGDKTLAVTSRTIHLNVLYKALLINYSVLNRSAHDSVTVAENETVGLQCEIEGHPTPTCEIYNKHNSDMEHHIKYSHNFATCSINFKASCFHVGVYKCKGANVLNTSGYTEKTINIFVECSPRPSPSVPVMDRVIAEINASISLYFTALSYPKPSSVLWRKFDGQSWYNVNDSSNIRIYQSNFDFGMTIIRASEAEFGEYTLLLSNAIGSYTHKFYIEHSAASSQSDVHGNTGLIIGLTIVVILLATIVTVFGVVWYKRRTSHKRPDMDVNNSCQNVSDAETQQNSDDREYEKVELNLKDSENTANGISKYVEDIEENNDISVNYEKLAEDRTDLNQYSQLHYMKEKHNDTGTEKSVSSDKDEQHGELSKVYINMKI